MKKQNGYSVIEIIVYIAIFAFFSITVLKSYTAVLGSLRESRTDRDLLESGSAIMERLSREIRQAKSVDVVNSTLGTSPGVLQLNSTTSGGSATVMKFITSSGAINLYQDGTLVGNLLGQNISVISLIFRRISLTNGEAVRIEMTLQDTRSTLNRTDNFYNTIILRGSY